MLPGPGESYIYIKVRTCAMYKLSMIHLPFLVLNFLFHIFDGIASLNFEGNRLSGQCLNKDLHIRCRCVVSP